MKIKMNNVHAVQDRESTFRHDRVATGYEMSFNDVITDNSDNAEENTVQALTYKIDGSGNTLQRFGIYSFRRNVKFVENNADNAKALKAINKQVGDLIKKHGADLTYELLKPVYDKIEALEFVNVFEAVDDETVEIPDGIVIGAVHPKLNVGLFDAPRRDSKLRYSARSYKANNYAKNDDNEIIISKQGESLHVMSQELAKEEMYDEIIDLYNLAEIDADAAKDPRNVIFNNAICMVK
jgi:uncharacterized protein YaaR (DUF327 family)